MQNFQIKNKAKLHPQRYLDLSPQKGFTLIEALVATAIFAILMVGVIGVYIMSIRINRRADAIRSATENARYISEFLSKEIRNGRISLSGTALAPCTVSPTASSNSLQITNVNGDTECFYLGNASGLANATGPYLWLIKLPSGGSALPAQQANLNYSQITALTFYIPSNLTTNQQRVTINGTVVYSKDPNNIITLPLQTTVSVLKYETP